MITRGGWLALVGALVLAVTGRILGVLELYLLAGVVATLVVGTTVWSRARRVELAVDRRLHPPRVHAGSPCTIELAVRNAGRRGTPVLEVRDAVSGTSGARLLLGPLAPGETASATYRLPTARRGILQVGPLQVDVDDPFGITDSRLVAAGLTELTVYPHVDDIAPVPQTTGNDPMAGAEHPNALGRGGEDFYALRPYTVGDDLRRVHWPSTARHDELMVRQDELPWQGRATVLLDSRGHANSVESLELVVSAAASVAMASAQREDLMRLATTDGYDSGFAAGHAHTGAIMEYLASLEAGPGIAFDRVVERLARSSTGGALITITAGLSPHELERVARLRTRFGSALIVWFEPSAYPDANAAGGPAPAGAMAIGGDAGFGEVWNRRMRRSGLVAGWRRTNDERGAWEPAELRHEFDPFARPGPGGRR